MFAYLEGDLTYKSPSLVTLAAGGVGYELHITLQTFTKIQHLEHCRLYTHLRIAEDSWTMYGFADEAERATFRHLLAITGVGAATSRLILSALTPGELQRAIDSEDVRTMQSVKGIGAKTAQRIVLELKGKLTAVAGNDGVTAKQTSWHNTKGDDALIALVNLGIGKSAAEAAIRKIGPIDELSVEDVIKGALRAL